jgi:hypothetical protein
MNKSALLEELNTALEHGKQTVLALSEEQAATPKALGKWSAKQIIGHLIDSALNNHQRFVRAQISAHLNNSQLELDGYAQDDWVRIGQYNQQSISSLLGLWLAINQQIAVVIAQTPDSAFKTQVKIGGGEVVILEFVTVDYVRHLKHHLAQLQALT